MVNDKTPKRKRRKRRMEEPLTNELLEELLNAPSPAQFTSRHHITQRDLPDYLQQLLDEKDLLRPNVIHEAQLNETYGYQIFMGQRQASRNKILQIVFGLHCTLQEANRVLQAAGHNELYCKNRRDAIIIFCLSHSYSLIRANEELYRFNEETVC